MTPLSHTADQAGRAGSAPAYLLNRSSARRSLLDRIESPRAVFALLGIAAIIGLALAFAVVHGLERFVNGSSEPYVTANGAATPGALHANPAPAPNAALAQTLSPALQYQVLNGTSGSDKAP